MSYLYKYTRRNSIAKLFDNDEAPKTSETVSKACNYVSLPIKKKSLLNRPVRRCSINNDNDEDEVFNQEDDIITIYKEINQRQLTNSFKIEIQNLIKSISGIDNVHFSNSKVIKVNTAPYNFQPDLPLSEYEKKAGFKPLQTKPIPPILNTLRNLELFVQKITNYYDRDFYGHWTTLSKDTLLDYQFALERIRQIREQASLFLLMNINIELLQEKNKEKIKETYYWKDSQYEPSTLDIQLNNTFKNSDKSSQKNHQLAESVHRNMAKFIIATFPLDVIMETLIQQAQDLKDLPKLKDRLCSFLNYFFNVFYNFYKNYFICNRDGCGNFIVPK